MSCAQSGCRLADCIASNSGVLRAYILKSLITKSYVFLIWTEAGLVSVSMTDSLLASTQQDLTPRVSWLVRFLKCVFEHLAQPSSLRCSVFIRDDE
jgi:hypothetical protein